MSCSCNSSPCNCQPRPSVCCTPTVESVAYTYENANLVGIGFFDNETDYLVQFRGAVSNSAALTITLDAGNNVLVWDFDQAALVADIPDADTTTRGILETATNAEAIAKAALDKILVPANLAALGASDTFAGLAEFATDVETQAGLSAALAVTPAGLASTYAALPSQQQFADAVARGAASPTTEGQIGYQLDTDIPYIGHDTAAGSWSQIFILGSPNNQIVGTTTTVTLSGASLLQFVDATTGSFVIFDTGVDFQTGRSVLFSSSLINFDTAEISINSVVVPADRIIITSSTPGDLSSALISDFLSGYNAQAGWATPTGTLDRAGFAAYNGQAISNPPTQAEVQALDDAVVLASQHLAALITDLKAKLLPVT